MSWRRKSSKVSRSFPFVMIVLLIDDFLGKGPSGENREYLYNLDVALLGLSEDSGDAHVSDLVERCRALEEEMGTGGGNEGEKSGEVLHKVGSTEEQEEVEK